MRLLNPGYEDETINNSLYWNSETGTCYNRMNNATTTCNFVSSGLANTAKSMIEDAVWYTTSSDGGNTASGSYIEERMSTTIDFSGDDGVTRTTKWIGKVGLMYPSDYGYASNGCKNGEQTLNNYNNAMCTSTNWLFNEDFKLLLIPYSEYSNYVLRVYSSGYVNNTYTLSAYSVHPTIYLSSSAKITGGTGRIDDMYQLSL